MPDAGAGLAIDHEATWEAAVRHVLEHEGGYADDPNDRGGATNRGITWRTLQEAQRLGIVFGGLALRDLTEGDARAIYRRLYWQAASCDRLPPALGLFTFDTAVNQGVGAAIEMLQRAAGVTHDGVVGPITLREIGREAHRVLTRMMVDRIKRYAALYTGDPSQRRYATGWLTRAVDAYRAAIMLEVSR